MSEPRTLRAPGVAILFDAATPPAVGHTTWNQITRLGEFKGHPQGAFAITRQTNAELVANFRATANLSTNGAQSYGGWESPTSLLRGHITGGHFLSAAAQMVNATGDAGLKATLAYMVGELAACQTANAALFGAGYLGAYPCVPLDRASASPAARPTHPGP